MAGAWLLIEFGQRLARNTGVSEAVISLVFVALGTSLPELFTAISAIRKKAENISVGNIFGANVLNMSMVVGGASLISPLRPNDLNLAPVDIPVACLICACAVGLGLKGGRFGRKTGVALLAIYILYLGSMVVGKRLGG
jgi:cation:H+ antiporter